MTKPDVLFGRVEVDPFCEKCHGPHKNPEEVEAFRERWAGKPRPNGRAVLPDSPCTDCHGKHVIIRTALTTGQ